MKTLLLLALLTWNATAKAETYTYKCNAPRNSQDSFLMDSYAMLTVDFLAARFQQFDTWSNPPSLMRDYAYKFVGVKTGSSKVAGMMEFALENENVSYGDNIPALYVDQELASGKNGALIFTGSHYSWDWNFCKRQD